MPQNTPFSFHCMICFEEFDPEVRFPVVLPCGHTYVCNECADRLDRCMECRTPLYTTDRRAITTGSLLGSQQAHQIPAAAAAAQKRTTALRYNRPQEIPPQRPVKTRLPLPKNVVLLSLIEATELTLEENTDHNSAVPHSSEDSTTNGDDSVFKAPTVDSQDEDEEEEKIKAGTTLAISVAGTYACAVRNGLDIFPSRPHSKDVESAVNMDGDVDTLVRFFHNDKKLEGDVSVRSIEEGDVLEEESNEPELADPVRLSFGDRVQVVTLEGGWAKLARGYGFVKADQNQLVKVGGPVDRACKIEALLRALSNRRKVLRIEQNKIDNKFIRLMNDLQLALQKDEDLTVICATIFQNTKPLEEEKKTNEEEVVEKSAPSPPPVPTQPPRSDADMHDDQMDALARANSMIDFEKPAPLERHPTPPCNRGVSLVCFANNVFDSDDETPFESSRRILASVSHPFMGGDPEGTRLFPAASHPSPSEMRAGARAWREQNSAHLAHANRSIDFRTGMSGHLALLSSHAHGHEYLEPNYSLQSAPSSTRSGTSKPSVSWKKMSSHTGLSVSKTSRNSLYNLLPALRGSTSPRSPPEGRSPREERRAVTQSGSM